MMTEDHNLNDEKVVLQVCEVLDVSVSHIDAETSHLIVAARKKALARAPEKFSWPKLLVATATAFSIFIAVILVNKQFNQPLETDNLEAIELVANVADQDAIDLYEDLEFYTWLVDQDVTG
jgi:hypothetical protein